MNLTRSLAIPILAATLAALPAAAQELEPTSLNSEIQVLPAPGPVKIDGKTDDWDLSAGVWSYNDPTIVEKTSVWTHLMWDSKGIYFLARYNDKSPMQNATMGKDFAKSWQADAYQARVIFDDKTPEEHQMHVNLFYSTPEGKPYMIVYHGGFGDGETGPKRPDLETRFSSTMEKAGGQIGIAPWPDGKGYNVEAFWPWTYDRLNGQPLKAGDKFTFGIEAMWGNGVGSMLAHRLADGITDNKVNRIFMFRARRGWGQAILSPKGNLDITQQQIALQQLRLKQFVNYDTVGSVPLPYTLPNDRDVTIAIDNDKGQRVRNLIGQYPRKAGANTDLWDGLDDAGKPVAAGKYTVTVVDHQPVTLRLVNSVYNAATPPWTTETGTKIWGSNHGYPTSAASRGAATLLGFAGTEGASGIMRVDRDGRILWTDTTETLDLTLDDKYAYGLSREAWSQRTLMRRFDLTTGRLVPFEDEAKSPDAVILPDTKIGDNCTIALNGDTLFALIPARGLFKIDPRTGKSELIGDGANLTALTDREGEMYGLLKDGTVVKLEGAAQIASKLFVATEVKSPSRIAFSQDKARIAITDGATNQVLVFDAKGKRVQTLGQAYTATEEGRPPGKFIETNFVNPLGLDFDSEGRLWVAEAQRSSKRVTCWLPDGKLQRQFWGSADYGAMSGFPITFDSTRFIAHGVEFQLDPNPDPKTRPTNEKPLLFHPALVGTRGLVYRFKGNEYAATAPGYNGGTSPIMIAKRGKDGVFRPCVRLNYGKTIRQNNQWVKLPGSAWVDANDNGREDAGETYADAKGRYHYWSNGWVRPDLTIITPDSFVYAPTGFTKSGVPLYNFDKAVTPANVVPFVDGQGSVGTIEMDAAGNISDGITYATVDGRKGSYPNRYNRHDAPAAQRGVLIAPFRTNGVIEGVPGVGSATALGGDRGEWFLMSMDGLYLSSILQDSKSDVTLDETFVGQESFGGFLWRDEKGRILAQLGGPSYRIVEVLGLETTRKNQTTIDVTADQISAGAALAAAHKSAAAQEPQELRIAKIAVLPTTPVSPDLAKDQPLIAGVPDVRIQEAGTPARWLRAAMAHDGKNLSIMYQVNDSTPWKNGEARFPYAFIGGDSVDIKLDIPGRGPIRILAAPIAGQSTVVYWQKQSTVQDNPITYAVANNLTNAQKFDVVRRLDNAKATAQTGNNSYSVLVTVPLAEIGLDPATMPDLKGIIGAIFSDPSGTNRASRLYWFDKSTGLVSDVPSESGLFPERWGKISVEK